jgi:hypothetical protein
MILFPNGIRVTKTEHKALLHLVVDPGDYIREALTEKARLRREALFTEWWARLSADPEVTTVPADSDALVTFIMARADFRTRVQQEEETAASEGLTFTMVNGNTDQYASKSRPAKGSVVLCSGGIDLPDADAACILAYVQNLEDWLYGALLGQINRGTKKMLKQYRPVMLADPEITTTPATEEGMVDLITSHKDYQSLPAQIASASEL